MKRLWMFLAAAGGATLLAGGASVFAASGTGPLTRPISGISTRAGVKGPPVRTPPRRLFRALLGDTASALKIKPVVLRQDLRAGKTPASLAVTEGSSAKALESTVTSAVESQLRKALTAGRITNQRESRLLARVPRLVDRFVTTLPPRRPRAAVRGTLLKDAASALHLSAPTLRKGLRAGDTLSAIAAGQGVTAGSLETSLTQDATRLVEQAVQNGRLTKSQAGRIEARLAARITRLVTHRLPPPPSPRRPV